MTWLTWPNRITIARIFMIVPLVLCLLNMDEWSGTGRRMALGLFGLIALGDALDGYLARRLGKVTPLGRFLDPLADKLLMTCTVILLAVPATAVPGARLPNWVPVLLIGKDVLVTVGFGLVYATTQKFYIQPRMLGKVCTLIQSAMIVAVLASPDLPQIVGQILPGLQVAAGGLAVAAAVDYLREGNQFARRHHAQEGLT